MNKLIFKILSKIIQLAEDSYDKAMTKRQINMIDNARLALTLKRKKNDRL